MFAPVNPLPLQDNEFLDTILKAQTVKEKIDKLILIKTKNLSVKDTVKRMKREAIGWDKIFAKHVSEEGLVSKTYKERLKFYSQKSSIPVKK